MGYVQGYASKVDITPAGGAATPYAVSSWSWDDTTPASDVGNTEGKRGNPAVAAGDPKFASRLPGQTVARLTLQTPAFDPTANEFAGPLAMESGSYYAIRIYPAGRGAGSPYHEFPSALCVRTGQNMGSINAPAVGSLEFETDGAFVTGAV